MDTAGEDSDPTQTVAMAPVETDQFGPYRVLSKLGEGGMGVVYLAEQREPIRRRVALKVVKTGMDSARVLGRFAQERQSLAMMNHPNIARILDAGTSANGSPYFAMEYIDGRPITSYCDDKTLTVRQRLELFLTVARAVNHAHEKGIIHRDLKPSNILVTEQDGSPVPKVIDFGIARVAEPWTEDQLTLTETGQMVGTPEYASPEQVSMREEGIDARSDVYSLGVVLYELLIGSVPFSARQIRGGGLAEMVRIILEEDAPPLSSKFSSLGEASTRIAACRQADAASLRRLVDGDLNAIALKALEKPRGRRYASVAEFTADISRYLEGKPVLAVPASPWYRASKFLRRNRTRVLGTTAAVATLALGVIAFRYFLAGDHALRSKIATRNTIVLADYDNRTGDPTFDDALRMRLSMELQDSPLLAVLPDAEIRRQLPLLGKPKDAKLTNETALEACERAGGSALVEGSIARLGNQFVVGLVAKDCSTGAVLHQQQATARTSDEILMTLTGINREFLAKAGEAVSSIQKHAAPLEATTHSIEALRAYSLAVNTALTNSNAEAIPFYRRAVELDPQFAVAYAFLGMSANSTGETELAIEATTKAWQLRDRVSERERYFIDFCYNRQVTGNLEKAYEILLAWQRAYPNPGQQPNPHSLLAGLAAFGTGRYEVAIRAAEGTLARNPSLNLSFAPLVSAYLLSSRLDETAKILDRAAASKATNIPELIASQYILGELTGNQKKMSEAVSLARGRRRSEHLLGNLESLALARAGQLNQARLSSNRTLQLAMQEGDQGSVGLYRAARTWWEALLGDPARARREASDIAAQFKARDAQYVAALTLAVTHDLAGAEAVSAELEKRFPEDTFSQFGYVPTVRALLAIARGKPQEAIATLETANRYENAANGLNFNVMVLGGLHSAFARGLAFRSLGRHQEAAAEFQKILDRPGLVSLDPIGVAAVLEQARTFALAGDLRKARGSYVAFLARWKQADPEAALLSKVKAEAAKLRL